MARVVDIFAGTRFREFSFLVVVLFNTHID
jgi:hypothetical protein